MDPQKKLKIYHIPTQKLVIMIDVARQELNKLLKRQKAEGSLPEDLEMKLTLWKNRYLVASADLRRRVNDKFNKIDSKPGLKEVKAVPPPEPAKEIQEEEESDS